ncbi:MAG: DUF4292 domain-containing protein [Saprospiraceae bacterium]
MQILFKFSFYLFLFGLLVTSCKSKKVIPTEQDISEKSTTFLLKSLGKNKIEAEWLTAKAKINYKDDNEKIKFTSYIRMRKDSVIWFVAKKAGVEAVRAQITTDSVYLINRQAKEYTIKGLDFFEEKYNMPSSFEAMQTMLLGNVLYLSNLKPDSEIKNNQHHLYVEKDNVRAEYWLNGTTYQLNEMQFSDIRNDQAFRMTFDDYKELEDEQIFSYFRNLNVSGKNTNNIDMDIKMSDVKINEPKNIKFEIPKRYKKVD